MVLGLVREVVTAVLVLLVLVAAVSEVPQNLA